MKTLVGAVVLASAAAFGAATWVYHAGNDGARPVPLVAFDTSLSADERISALEQAVSDERMARQLLQEEVLVLTAELEALRDDAPAPSERAGRDATSSDEEDDRRVAMFEGRRQRFELSNSPAARAERLVEAGFGAGRAEWIVQREEELRMDALQARYEAGRSGDPADFFRDQAQASNALRAEIGDADYERYLEANGRPTTIGVSSVIGSSPAETAGLRSGDQITHYAGERVFSMTDISLASMDGIAGENVVVDIVREGVPMQVVLPRGPLGITGGRPR